MLASAFGYLIGSLPLAYLAGRAKGGVDIRERGSGSTGASNVWQSVSRWLVVPVGVAQIAQGAAAVLLARALGFGDAAQVAGGIGAVVANDWNAWLGFKGGRGIGASIGVLGAIAPWALAAFIAIALAGVVLRAIPQWVALALLATPLAAAATGAPDAAIAGCALLAGIAMLKRLLANGPPAGPHAGTEVWRNRLLYDRDIRDRDAWVRRGVGR